MTQGTGNAGSGEGRSDRPVAVLDAIAGRLAMSEDRVPSIPVHGIACEPERVCPGDIFVALEGRRHGSIRCAVDRGAIAVVVEPGLTSDPGVPVVLVQDAVRALGHLASRLFGEPSRELRTCAIVGSFGKSSTARLAQNALLAAGLPAGRVRGGHGLPRAHELHRQLSRLRDEGAAACVVEAPSREAALGRFEGVRFDGAVFLGHGETPNDFFPSPGAALEAQADFMRGLPSHAVAAINSDDPEAEVVVSDTQAKVVTFGFESSADVKGRILRMDSEGTGMEVRTPVGTLQLRTRLVGRPHAINALGALTVALTLGADLDAAARGIASTEGLPGRMERLRVPLPFPVIVDRAPDAAALARVLDALRPLVPHRLLVVIGARDGEAGSGMAQVAAAAADAVVVTEARESGNPLRAIKESLVGMDPARVWLDPTREGAVALALDRARKGDGLLIVGSGDGSEERMLVRDWCIGDLERASGNGTEMG